VLAKSSKEIAMDRDESKAIGGFARAESLTPEERQEIARRERSLGR
jgi:hypothetical protein